MRAYSQVAPTFWTGTTGREIRYLGRATQLVALYLLTCPSANMAGLFYLPLPTLSHETGVALATAKRILKNLGELEFAHYDVRSETVWVVAMARYQVGEELKPGDKRIPAIVRELEQYRSSAFFNDYLKRYGEAFHLEDLVPAGSTSEE